MKWIRSIVAFIEVSEKKSFSRAADSLGVSKSQVSKLITQLEENFGTPLLSRTTRQMALTPKGSVFLNQCQVSLKEIEKAQLRMLEAGSAVRGRFRISVAGAFSENYIAPILIRLAKRFPQLEVEMSFNNKKVDLFEEEFDAAIRVGPKDKKKSLTFHKIASRREFVCASESYLVRKGALKTPSDLKNHDCLVGASSDWCFQRGTRKLLVTVNEKWKTNNARVLLQACLDGLGVVKLPGVYVSSHLKSRKLVQVLEDYTEDSVDIWLVTPSHRHTSPVIKSLLDELKMLTESEF